MEYYTTVEVANKFKVSKQAVAKWIDAGILKAERIGIKSVRIKFDEVEKFAKERNGAWKKIAKEV